MKIPVFLPATTLLFWAWQTGHWLPGIACAVMAESHRLIKTRRQLSFTDYRRAASLSAGLVVALFAVFAAIRGLPYAVIPAIIWLPVATLPLLLAQNHSTRQNLEVEALLFLKRRSDPPTAKGRCIDINWPYLALCLLAASAANVRDLSFYAGMCTLALWALWQIRPAKVSLWLWLITLGLAGLGGYTGANGLENLQQWFTKIGSDFFGGGNVDPYRTATDIGEIGELKLASKIMLRITGPESNQGSFLLHRASYDSYGEQTWFAPKAEMKVLTAAQADGQWQLSPVAGKFVAGSPSTMHIRDELPRGSAVLSLPAGATAITSPDFDALRHNRLGVIKAFGRPGATGYSVKYQQGVIQESAPTDQDLRLPRKDTPALKHLAGELQLSATSPQSSIQNLKQFFEGEFRYALFQPERTFEGSPLRDFLLHNRFGHCEYFATAAAMLLRAAGIPARYAVGYSAQEYSHLEQAWLVRQRHAHAWTRVWTGTGWEDLDTTPITWIEAENARASSFESILDLLSWLQFQLSQWRQALARGELSPWWAAPLVIIFLWIGRRYRKRGSRHFESVVQGPDLIRQHQWPGQDSGYYRIESRLADIGLVRQVNESPQDWYRKALQAHPKLLSLPRLDAIIEAHYYYRFNPERLSGHNHKVLTEGVTDWLNAFELQAEELR